MRTRDLLYLVFSNLKRMKVRAGMTASGVLIGTVAVILLISLGLGLQRNFAAGLGQMGDLTFLPVRLPMGNEILPGGGFVPGADPSIVLKEQTLETFRQIAGVSSVTPQQYTMASSNIHYKNAEVSVQVFGIDPEQVERLKFPIEKGEAIIGSGQIFAGANVGKAYFDRRKKEFVYEKLDLYDQWAELVFTRMWDEPASEPGVILKTVSEERTVRVRIAGVLEEINGAADNAIYMPLNEVESINAWYHGKKVDRERYGYEMALVRVSDLRYSPGVEKTIRELGYSVDSNRKFMEEMNRMFLMIQLMLTGVGGVALLVSAFGIANTMIMAIYERTREIGLLKSLGATNADVMLIFLCEAGSIGLLGGLGGVIAALGLSKAIQSLGGDFLRGQGALLFGGPGGVGLPSLETLYMPAWLLGGAVIFAVLIGTLSGVYPAVRAAGLDPLEALRYE